MIVTEKIFYILNILLLYTNKERKQLKLFYDNIECYVTYLIFDWNLIYVHIHNTFFSDYHLF